MTEKTNQYASMSAIGLISVHNSPSADPRYFERSSRWKRFRNSSR
jgi:hypothetical protein